MIKRKAIILQPQPTEDCTPEQRIDAALESVLRASGTSLRYHTLPKSLAEMREAMRKIISDSYIAGSNDCWKAIEGRKPSTTPP